MYHSYSTAFSHIILTLVGIYCWKSYTGTHKDNIYQLPLLSYGIITLHSLLGIWKWGNPALGHKLEKPYHMTKTLQNHIVFPCIVTQLYLNYYDCKQLAFIHLLMPAGALLFTRNRRSVFDLLDILVGLNILSCIYVSFSFNNFYGITTALSYAINHFLSKNEIFDMPSFDFYNYALCFYSYFSLCTLHN